MKTIEEKAQAYDFAVKRIKNEEIIDHMTSREIKEFLFPELAESEDEKIRKAIIMFFETQDDNTTYSFVPKKDILAWLEKQKEQKQITSQDLKPGDVLIYPDGTFTIYKYFVEDGLYMAYVIQEPKNIRFNSTCTIFNAAPATKEQRELLFAKMKEAGYEWDPEKLELKKIEQTPAEWSEEDEMQLDAAIHLVDSTGHTATTNWLKSIKDRVQLQSKQGWSEDDEDYCIDANVAIDNYFGENYAEELRGWLKSFKDRCTWKPNDEQMEALLYEVNAWDEDSVNGQNLKSLYQGLKKIKGE